MNGAQIYSCEVMHQRLFPVQYRFRYRIVTALFDIDRVDALAGNHRWFSLNRFNLFSLHTRDHGRRDGSPWRPWIEARLAEHGVHLDGGRIRLLAMPRILGYAFNPLSVWYCEHRDGSPRAVLLEVRNTFNEHHHYLLHEDGAPITWPVRASKPKQFHVSPFIDMTPVYGFRLGEPGESLRIAIQEYQDNELMLVATQSGQAREFSDRTLLRTFAAMPWATARVMVLIHWQALKIWLRGGRYHPKPKPPVQEVS
ncbi:MAG: DUF1365 domain-containing protein [Thioalkalivibrio sp.]|nr:DUF1365 domain-containing protein [Thioalkalivibrio sp.]